MSLGEESAQDTLGVLQGKGDKFTKLSIIERKKLADLEDAIAYVSAETAKYRSMAKKAAIEVMNVHVLTPNPAYSRADGVNIAKEAHMVTSKTLIVLEAKLNKLLQRKSEIQNQNKRLKDEINHFRLLRLQTDVAHAKFEAVLGETKERIEGLLGESTGVVEERERQLEKKKALEVINVEEQLKFQEEYERMGRYIKEQNVALEDSLLKERKADRKGRTTTKEETPVSTGIATSDLSLAEEIEMAKKVGTLTSFMAAEQSSLSDLRRKIGAYESMFDQLKSMTGVESLEEMVSNYISHEEEMFSLYNFIQTINTEIDATVEATAQTEADISQYQNEQNDQDQQRRTAIDELQQRLASTLEITRQLDAQNTAHQESVSQIGKKVYTLFFKLQCDQMDTKGAQVTGGNKNQKWSSGARPESKIALLTSQGVSESNVVDYLGCIEQRAVDIISEYLRVVSAQQTANGLSTKMPTNLPRSPTPGPSTPMKWQSGRGGGGPFVDLTDLSDDEYMVDGPLENSEAVTFGLDTVAELPTTNAGPSAESDNKPIDLSAYKSKLQRKLGLSESKSGSALFRSNTNNTFDAPRK
mmetsp:Transcript_4424/g.9972  ORF Transcript_4424/g.9972 Transcript_4424/m.9972 type:complete len:584 (-) Transcript_4424:70-1821(-)|eukprot:CAMPEP_0173297868 /NCGR_PEP_ID=MMETSP1143-20121109/15774_1 /TAXON_ID=483371 /ORGANISM="non described non described, Strain CCMP2298" /LENGTH=583 /DNA_ID=CAMNT_0014237917 /DNA_START=111 /DNA_END=1862 /DNA_ORIENTATION=+